MRMASDKKANAPVIELDPSRSWIISPMKSASRHQRPNCRQPLRYWIVEGFPVIREESRSLPTCRLLGSYRVSVSALAKMH